VFPVSVAPSAENPISPTFPARWWRCLGKLHHCQYRLQPSPWTCGSCLVSCHPIRHAPTCSQTCSLTASPACAYLRPGRRPERLVWIRIDSLHLLATLEAMPAASVRIRPDCSHFCWNHSTLVHRKPKGPPCHCEQYGGPVGGAGGQTEKPKGKWRSAKTTREKAPKLLVTPR
jgi:hypothetical protein